MMYGVLCVYLLLGTVFAFLYGLAAEVDDGGFFATGAPENQADFLYFSFSTLTTTGYGDLTAATGLGRSLSITEALLGQIYLVTVVALIVGNLGRSRSVTRDA
jgi:Ion channel